MGILVAKKYPTSLFAKAADHTYVECSTGAKGWSCWGGKAGGTAFSQGVGTTAQADAIAEPNERAGITCYLINGVCHQAANRILLPANVLVSGARGYWVSHGLFGTYGRIGLWPCHAPFNQHTGVTGDLPPCAPPSVGTASAAAVVSTTTEQLDWNYIRVELELYAAAVALFNTSAVARIEPPFRTAVVDFHVLLFANMIDYYLGPRLDSDTRARLVTIRRNIEVRRMDAEASYADQEITGAQFVAAFNEITIDFQSQAAEAITDGQYETLFRLRKDEQVVLADPAIVAEVFGG